MVDYENRIVALEEASKSNKEEHKEIMKRLNEKDIQDAVMREQLDTVVKTTNRIEEKIDEQNKVPANRWNTVVVAIITGIISAGIGAVISMLVK